MASSLSVTNNSGQTLTIYLQAIPNGTTYVFNASGSVAAVCSDGVFRTNFLAGNLQVYIDGIGIPAPSTSEASEDLLDQIASGNVSTP